MSFHVDAYPRDRQSSLGRGPAAAGAFVKMELAEKTKLLERTLDGLAGRAVVVEGKRDIRALREAGVQAKATAAVGRPERIVEKIRDCGEVFLLFDFDGEGERKTRVFRELFEAAGVRVDVLARKRLRQLLGIRTFEELAVKLREFDEKLESQNRETREKGIDRKKKIRFSRR